MTNVNVARLAKLANLKVIKKDQKKLDTQFSSVVELVSKIQKLNLNNLRPTTHVSNTKNVLREDIIDSERILSQEASLANAHKKYNGYFVVNAVLDNKDE